ncbi:GIY-YIG nuclease family protein [Apilactobacillus xinyiensis]|uniref:GIY-YIG nuclease family protein n=1 Tax=Apilactobacillus xinyiensis TaxID=2841032 RepID=A0ABT0HZK6_9LACO|nr:GIY-YIG nuclease family protein [Apilactobacillus xinyiensis]MCK8624015.1 GIY-YIG nuclease family protein [Apilactobacillus xinyiensis]MCL0330016.1 GIY-YIG nuclease family protein [Apilactobacillus xinyiensis]
MENSKYYFYVLKCGDNSLYGGYTTNVQQRLLKHQAGKGAKYTRSHLPVELIYYESFSNKHLALQKEYQFKHQTRNKKIMYLINHGVDRHLL